ncbi:E3 ubiquitin-protein ligase RNF128 isoform X2 [Dipodomys merriami]|uniref:E3 ubiquitin-protein ligase RNF128 isoform X2 n=1 Tax=Dipodomys merriami TaxID=94247 RepID=UPI00385586CC
MVTDSWKYQQISYSLCLNERAMNKKNKYSVFQLLVIFIFLLKSTASFSAFVTVTYYNETSNSTKTDTCECGVYGLASPVINARGVVAIPKNSNYQACDYNTEFTTGKKPWIALIEGGNCSYFKKIQTAARRNADAVVIYSAPEPGNQTTEITNFGAGDIVAIMIGNLKGTKILHSIQRGIQVTMVIEVGKKHGPWVNHYSIFFVSVSFFIITAATVGYFIFYSARRLRNARAQSRKQRQLKADAKKAIGRLQLRTLKQGDKEIGPDGDSCAVCIELYKPNDLVRILTCNHIFHKTCVDPWLLEHRTCPMCKCDILKALGIEVDIEDGSVSLQVPVSNDASNSASPHEEDNRSETASSGYASVQGADEPPLEEHVQSANENLQLVNHEASSVAVDVVPHIDNPTFEEDEPPDQETAVREIKS